MGTARYSPSSPSEILGVDDRPNHQFNFFDWGLVHGENRRKNARPAAPDGNDRASQSHLRAQHAWPSAVEGQGGGEPGEEPHPRPHRARVRHAGKCARRPPRAHLGIVRARAKIGLQNFVYNIRRLATLERMAAA